MEERLLTAIWLQMLMGYGSARAGEILRLYGGPQEVYRHRLDPEFLRLLTRNQLNLLEGLTLEQAMPTLTDCLEKNVRILPWDDENFPTQLADLPEPPIVLYVTGDVSALSKAPKVGMVGSRRPSAYGVRVCAEMGGQLARAGVVLISGLADGLDSEAHKAAVEADAPTIGVLGNPIQHIYPAANARLRREMEEKGGAVISEYGPRAAGGKNYFLLRNRLIAGLSDALCVVEARKKSGTMSTVHRAESYGVPVYAVPGNVFSPLSEGTNELIADGRARILRGADALLKDLGMSPEPAAPVHPPVAALSATAKRLLNILGDAPLGIDAICAAGDLPAGRVLAALTELEIAGQVSPMPGRQYRLR